MPSESAESRPISIVCAGCGGNGQVAKPRLRLHLGLGEASTEVEWVPCPYCRGSEPGRRTGFEPPV